MRYSVIQIETGSIYNEAVEIALFYSAQEAQAYIDGCVYAGIDQDNLCIMEVDNEKT